MSKIRISGDTSGYVELSAPNVAGSTEIVLPDTGGTLITDQSLTSSAQNGQVLVADSGATTGLGWDFAGKILQVVKGTSNAGEKLTTSTSLVDVDGYNVTITPKKVSSAIMIIANISTGVNVPSNGEGRYEIAITTSGNAVIYQAQHGMTTGGGGLLRDQSLMIGYNSPNTTSATTYKLRFAVVNSAALGIVRGGELYAIEIGA